MKLLGIELEGFASFERQFIRLQPGINLLVGRNNAGKTSVLRALTLLKSALAVHQPQSDANIGAYARRREPQPHFDLAVVFQFEEADPPPFDLSQGFKWGDFIARQNPIAAVRLRMWVRANILGFRGVEMWLSSGAMPLIEVLPGGLSSIGYFPPQVPGGPPAGPNPYLRVGLRAGSAMLQPDGLNAHVGIKSPLVGGLDGLRNIRFVTPHRVVSDRLPLSTSQELAANASDLAPYLQTLHNNQRRKFQAIEDFVTSSFPEFERVDPASEGNHATLRLVLKDTDDGIPLTHCGTGVEQILALAAVVTASKPGEIILMDEPHSFLHPAAERGLLKFLAGFPDRYFVIATHSAVFVNGVAPDRITHLQNPGTPYAPLASTTTTSAILHDLGYRNSDALFFDQLVIIEGPSDAAILARLLCLDRRIQPRILENTGFPSIDGVNDTAREIQTKILRFEKLLVALGRAKMPRLYLLDGDRKPEDVTLLRGTRSPTTGEAVDVRFLHRLEIENYLLVPDAIASALSEEAQLAGIENEVDANVVAAKLEELLAIDDDKLFPSGRTSSPIESVKASRLLEKLYAHFGNLRYDKNRSGQVIAKNINVGNAVGMNELFERLDILK